MSGSKSASIKLTINKGPFKDGLKESEKDVQAFGDRANAALNKGFKDGIKGAESSLKSLGSSIKSGLAQFSGIGGALGMVELVKLAVQTEGAFKGVAAGIRFGTGAATDFRALMADGSTAASKWGKDVDEVGRSMKRVWEETGDTDFTKSSVDTIAMVSRASRENVEMLGGLSGELHKKFGITNADLGDTLAAVLSLGNKGGVTVDELSGSIGRIGAFARESGLQGQAGFQKMLALLNMGDEGAKNLRKNIASVGGILEHLGTNGKDRSMLLMKLGLDPSQVKGDATAQIGQILKSTGGNKDKLAMGFEGDQLTFMVELGKKYSSAFAATTGDVKTKTAAGLAAYNAALEKAGHSAVTGADLQDMANAAMEGGPAKMDAAMQKMRAAFLKPEIADAVGKLADVLPKLAEVVSWVVSNASAHPLAAGAAVIGGTAAKGFAEAGLSSIIASAFARGGASAAATAGAGLAAAGPAAGTAIATAAGGGLSTVAAAIGPQLAAAFAVAALALLADQLMGLKKDLSGPNSVAKKDKAGSSPIWREFLHDIGAMDDKHYQEAMAQAGGITDPRLTGADYNPETEAGRRASEARKDLAGMNEQAGASLYGMSSADDAQGGFDGGPLASRVAKTAPSGAGRSAEDARLFADMMGQRELKVRIMNPEQIREGGGGGAGGGSPRPGYVER